MNDQANTGGAGIGRRRFLGGAVAGGAGLLAASAWPAAADVADERRKRSGSLGMGMRWLGVSGWELRFDGHVLWFDPYVSRFDYRADGGALRVRPDVIEHLLATGQLSGPPEAIMVSHGHWDHMADVPYFLNRPQWSSTPIITLGTETNRNLLTAMGVEPRRSSNLVQVVGGEYLSFADGEYTVRVVRSLHSQSANYGYFAPGTRTSPPPPPQTIHDLVEGSTLAYVVTVPERFSILLFGGTNFDEQELAGLRPDVVAVSMTSHTAVHAYLDRLLTVLGEPRYVMPCHHDDMVTGYDDPNLAETVDQRAVQELREAVRRLRLRSEVIAPEHLVEVSL